MPITTQYRLHQVESQQGRSNPGPQGAAMAGTTGSTSFLYSLTAGLTQPIFDHGALAGQRDNAIAQRDALVAAYRITVLNALSDVQNALYAIKYLDQQQRAQTTLVADSNHTFHLIQLEYNAGARDFLTVLTTEQTLFGAEDQLSQLKLTRLQAAVTLFQTLGGGLKKQSLG